MMVCETLMLVVGECWAVVGDIEGAVGPKRTRVADTPNLWHCDTTSTYAQILGPSNQIISTAPGGILSLTTIWLPHVGILEVPFSTPAQQQRIEQTYDTESIYTGV